MRNEILKVTDINSSLIDLFFALNLCNDFSGCVLSTRDSIFTPSPHGIFKINIFF